MRARLYMLLALPLIVGVLGCAIAARTAQAQSAGLFQMQFANVGCGSGQGTAAGTLAGGGQTGWVGNASLTDVGCVRTAVSGSAPANTDMQLCIVATDAGGFGGFGGGTGPEQCTGWASAGGGWSGWANDAADVYTIDRVKIRINTRAMSGYTMSDGYFGVQLSNNNCASGGPATYSPHITAGGGWSGWVTTANGTALADCVRVFLQPLAAAAPSSGTLTASPSSLPSTGGSVTLTWTSTNTSGGGGVTLWNLTDNVMIGTSGGTPSIPLSGSKIVTVNGAPKTFRLDTWNSASQAGSSATKIVTATAAASCTVNGTSYPSGYTGTFYSSQTSSNCAGISQSRTCTNGVMSGSSSYIYSTCSAPPTVTLSSSKTGGSPYTNQSTLAIGSGDTVALSWSSTNATSCSGSASPSDSSFAPSGTSGTDTTVTEPTSGNSRTYTVTCTGPGGSASDSVIVSYAAASCTVNGNSYASGSTNTFYNTTSVPYGQSCSSGTYSQSRTCTNGVMSGTASYQYASCSTQAPASCTLDGVS